MSDDNAADNMSRFIDLDSKLCEKCISLSKGSFAYPHDPSRKRRAWMKERNADTPLSDPDKPLSDEELEASADFMDELESCDPYDDDFDTPPVMMQEEWFR